MTRVVLVTARWGDTYGESGAVIRLIAGALSRRASVEIISLKNATGPSGATDETTSRRDSVFVVHELAATKVEREHAGVLRAALAVCDKAHLPEISGPRLAELYGARAEGVAELLGSLRPDSVLLAGPETWWLPEVVSAAAPGARLVSVPFTGQDALGALAPVVSLFTEVDAVGVMSRGEATEVKKRMEARRCLPRPNPTEVTELEVAFGLNRPAAEQLMVGMSHFGRFVVLLTGFPDDSPAASRSPGHDYVRRLLGPVAVAEVARGQWRISDDKIEREVPVGSSRPNLLKLLAHAVACLDLRPQGVVGRETLESLLLGTPVVVPDNTVAAEHAERSNGGLWYRDFGELFDAGRAIVESESLREALSADGRRWAEAVHGDHARFTQQVASFALGR